MESSGNRTKIQASPREINVTDTVEEQRKVFYILSHDRSKFLVSYCFMVLYVVIG